MTDPVPCPECGSRPHANDRYCPECGAQLATAVVASGRVDPAAGEPGQSPNAGRASAVETDAPAGGVTQRAADEGQADRGDGAMETAERRADGQSDGAHSGRAEAHAGNEGAAVGAAANAAAYGTWTPRAASGQGPTANAGASAAGVAGAGFPAGSASIADRGGTWAAGGATGPGPRAVAPEASAVVNRPISPAAAAAAAAAVQADRQGAADARRTGTTGEDAGWFAATSPGSMLMLGLVLVAVGVLLVLVGKIDRTGTIGIFGLLIAVGGAFMIPLAGVRAVAGRFL